MSSEHSTSLMPFPNLPVDICRRILKTLALSDDKASCLILVLVSKTVQEWINPILFRTLTPGSAMRQPQLEHLSEALQRGPEPLTQHVRDLAMFADEHRDSMLQILSSCISLQKIALWGNGPGVEALLPAISSTVVTHFASNCNIRYLYPMPRSLTHLCLLVHGDDLLPDTAALPFRSLFESNPAVTHIMFHRHCPSVRDLHQWLFHPTGLLSLACVVLSVAPKTFKAMICHPSPYIEDASEGIVDPEGSMANTVHGMHEAIADDRFVLVCPDPAHRDIEGMACYPKFHNWIKEWECLLPEDEMDVWEMADHYLDIQAVNKNRARA